MRNLTDDLKKAKSFLFTGERKAVLFRQFLSLAAVVFLSQLLLQWFQNELNLELVFRFAFQWHMEKFLISWCVLMVPALFLWSLLGNVKLVNVLYLFTATVLGYITFEKMQQRGEPFYPSDFRMAGEISFLLEMLPPWTLFLLAAGLLLALFLLFYLWKKGRRGLQVIPGKRLRIGMFLFTSLMMLYVSRFQAEDNLIKKAYDRTAYWIPYSQQMNYYNNGFVAGFLYNLSSAPMQSPEGYNEEGLRSMMEKYRQKATEINESRKNRKVAANVIFIMNESFADPFDLKELPKTWDPIPYTRKLAEGSRSGKMLSQGYGGGTANIEFEALTGLSMEPFAANISTPFTQFLPKEENFPSVVSRLKKDGHEATAIHPFDTTMYKRTDNYHNLGFDRFFYNETMKYTKRYGHHPYISDEAAYQEVLYRMKETDQYDFIHLVTMQNHTPYEGKYDLIPSYQETGFGTEAINQYLQDLRFSDEAMKQFKKRLDEWEEPTVVVFWGDHWPSVFGETTRNRNGTEILYQTPAVIFSNQAMDAEELGVTSPIYFFNEVLDILNAKVTPFEAFLLELREKVPAFEKGMYYSREKEGFVPTREGLSEEAQNVLAEYDWLMYDHTTGERFGLQNGFFNLSE